MIKELYVNKDNKVLNYLAFFLFILVLVDIIWGGTIVSNFIGYINENEGDSVEKTESSISDNIEEDDLECSINPNDYLKKPSTQYYLIVGSYSTIEEAAKNIYISGHPFNIYPVWVNGNKSFRVYQDGADNKSAALRCLNSLKIDYPDAWICGLNQSIEADANVEETVTTETESISPPTSGQITLTGHVGQPLTMVINIDEDDMDVTGYCYYNKYGPDHRMALSGTRGGSEDVSLSEPLNLEITYNGEVTGVTNGDLMVDRSTGRYFYKGCFTNVKGQQFEFILR